MTPSTVSGLERIAWDYIIVGAGTAGCVLANRLSADPGNRVLLIEAGGRNRSIWVRVPVGYFRTIGDPRFDWRLRTEPEPHLHGRQLDWPRGRGLGGSSAINGLIYVRGQREDFDAWGRQARGWSYEEVLPYFKRAERQERGADAYHGDEGPLGVSDARVRFAITERFREAARAWGLPDNPDCNGAAQEGVGTYQTTTWKGWRVSNAHAYLRPLRRRPNVTICTDLTVRTILLDGARATGVRARTKDGRDLNLTAARETILSAGAIGSPHLLLLSGIGPADHLRQVGVEPRLDLPGVGAGLQDHLKFHNSYRVRIPTLNQRLNSHLGRLRMGLQFALTRRGPLTMGAAPVFAFLRSGPTVTRPDIQFHVVPWSSPDPTKGFDAFPGFSVSICPLRPESRGWVRLASPDPGRPPRLRANYLSVEGDCLAALGGLARAREICAQTPLGAVIEAELWPGPDLAGASEEALLDAIRARVTTIFHPVGSVAMGDAPEAPLDPRCCLRGVAGLRVVDASVMPQIISGNTNAAVTMIAEKVSDLILEDARQPARG